MSAPRPRPGVIQEDVPETGECVLLDAAGGRVLALNALGAAVWELLDGTRDAAELARIVAEAAGVGPARARADVDALLAELTREGFLLGS